VNLGRDYDLTPDEIRACPAFAHFTDAQVNEVIETIKTLSFIIFEYYQKNRSKADCTP